MKSDVLDHREEEEERLYLDPGPERRTAAAAPGGQPPPQTACSSSSAPPAQQRMNEAARGTKDAVRPLNSSPGSPAAASGFHKTFTQPECERQSSITCLV